MTPMAFRSTRARVAAPPPPAKAESILTVPEALLEWGREPQRVVGWPRDWAREVQDLVVRSEEGALDEKLTEQFLSRLEGLVVEALRAGRPDLLVGLDVQTMEWLGLMVEFPVGEERVSVGRAGTFTWSEVRVLHEAWEQALLARRLREEQSGGDDYPEPDGIGSLALKVKRLLRGAWPEDDVRLGAVSPAQELLCTSCDRVLVGGSVELEGDLRYCGRCWSEKIDLPAKRAEEALLEARRRAQAAAVKRSKSN